MKPTPENIEKAKRLLCALAAEANWKTGAPQNALSTAKKHGVALSDEEAIEFEDYGIDQGWIDPGTSTGGEDGGYALTQMGLDVAHAFKEANTPHPYAAARAMLAELHKIFLKYAHLNWSVSAETDDEPDNFAHIGLDADGAHKALELLVARGLAKHKGQRAYVINENGIRAREHPNLLDATLPLPQTAPETVAPLEVQGGFDIAAIQSKLAFVQNSALMAVLARDLGELRKAMEHGMAKSALLLCGSILEGVLFEVVGRNLVIAKTYRPRKSFPDDYSLDDLIGVGTAEGFLPPSLTKMAGSLTEHRDLIHPAAELRGEVKVDGPRASAMVAFLVVLVADLAESHEDGRIDAYAKK